MVPGSKKGKRSEEKVVLVESTNEKERGECSSSEVSLGDDKIQDCGDHMKLSLDEKECVLFDESDLSLIKRYRWHKTTRYEQRKCPTSGKITKIKVGDYCRTSIRGQKGVTTLSLAKLILESCLQSKDENTSINYINGNTLDNRRCNLRLADARTRRINGRVSSNNTSGYKGVYHNKKWNEWRARWSEGKGKRRDKSFSCKKYGYEEAKRMAIEYRKKMESESPDYIEALKGRDY
jgi:co-chaperonin GroES (HSP10)